MTAGLRLCGFFCFYPIGFSSEECKSCKMANAIGCDYGGKRSNGHTAAPNYAHYLSLERSDQSPPLQKGGFRGIGNICIMANAIGWNYANRNCNGHTAAPNYAHYLSLERNDQSPPLQKGGFRGIGNICIMANAIGWNYANRNCNGHTAATYKQLTNRKENYDRVPK